MINKHQDWQEQIPFYVAQSLSPEQQRSFEIHLATCATCQAEIDEWRMIASAVWREADDAARKLPPLSQEVYNRLSYRDKPPVSRYAANPPRPQTAPVEQAPQSLPQMPTVPNVKVLPRQRRMQLPVTLVAGLLVAVIMGGLLLSFALNHKDGNGEVALGLTEFADSTEEAGTGLSISPTPNNGIIPTLEATETEASITQINGNQTQTSGGFITNTPEPQPTIQPSSQASIGSIEPTRGQSIYIAPSNPTLTPSPTASNTPEPIAPLGAGPYVTITPGLYSDGMAYCEIYNPTTVNIEIYMEADSNSQIASVLMPSQVLRVFSLSEEGWYYVGLGWINPRMAYLRGSCYADYDIPFATPFSTPEPSPTYSNSDSYEPSSGYIVVINAAYADLLTAPDFSSGTVGVASRNQQFAVIGYQGSYENRFVNVALPDGGTAWIWAQIVIEYPVDQVPPSPTP